MLVGFLILILFFHDFKKGKIKKDIFAIIILVTMSVGDCTMAVTADDLDGNGEIIVCV